MLNATRKKPTNGSTHWSCRKFPNVLGINKDLVHRMWQDAGLKLHWFERYVASNDRDFEQNPADIIGLYLNPPQHTAVFCVEERSAIQALDRLHPVLSLSAGPAERHWFEYYRLGTLSLCAALDIKTGKVQVKTGARHIRVEFVEFLREVVGSYPANQKIDIILNNSSAHKTKLVSDFIINHPNVTLYITPTYSSRLNQIEIWFSRIQCEVIARGVFSSVSDLTRKLLRCIRAYSAHAKPFNSKYSDPTLHIGNVLFATSH